MKFHLSFEGSLPSSGSSDPQKPRPAKLKAIWAIREVVNLQLLHLVKTHPAFSGRSSASRVLVHELIPPIVVDGYRFFAIARARLSVKCSLKIDLLVNHAPGSIVTKKGDLDNRLKTLLDGLRIPTSQQEIRTFTSQKMLEENDYICLLEDDVLITALQIEMVRNFAVLPDLGEDHVKANIAVTIEPSESSVLNEAFQAD
jgi:hypothetical protein